DRKADMAQKLELDQLARDFWREFLRIGREPEHGAAFLEVFAELEKLRVQHRLALELRHDRAVALHRLDRGVLVDERAEEIVVDERRLLVGLPFIHAGAVRDAHDALHIAQLRDLDREQMKIWLHARFPPFCRLVSCFADAAQGQYIETTELSILIDLS